MNDVREQWTDDADDTVRLLRLAGPRSPVPAIRAARVRAAVHAQWQTNRRRRVIRVRVVSSVLFVATAASVVLMIGRFNLANRRAVTVVGEPVAVVEQINGTPRRVTDASTGPTGASLSPNEAVRTGEWVETDAGARVALRFSEGTSVRLDVGSRARPLSANVIELSAGAVYVDTGRESGRFEVRTALATAHDVGTQFEVRLLDRSVRLRVRTGLVELRDGARSVSGRAGTEIMLSGDAAVSRPFAVHGPEWEWIARLSPPLDMEGLTLARFLQGVAREQGWTLRYADPPLAKAASGIILHGSVNGLPPGDAVEVAITASGLRYRLENGQLVVLRTSDRR